MPAMRSVLVLCIAAAWAAPALAQAVGPAQLSTCRAAISALGLTPALTGNTVFCPTNAAFDELATDLGIRATGAARTSALLAAAKANPDVFKTILSFHVARGQAPAASLKSGQKLTTLLRGAPQLEVEKTASGVEILHPEGGAKGDDHDHDHEHEEEEGHEGHDHEGMHADKVVAADLTFDGPYARSSKTYIVHAIDHVMIPEAAVAGVKKLQASLARAGRKLML